MPLDDVTLLDSALRMGASVFLGAVLGFDRERKDKPAGLRTHAMVSLGATTFTLVTLHFLALGDGARNADPIKLVDGLVGGIGFLGAGTIIQSRGRVEGITTAATIWVAGAVGLTCGIGEYGMAFMTVFGAILVLDGLNLVKKRVNPEGENHH